MSQGDNPTSVESNSITPPHSSLQKQVQEIDQREDPALDREARQAYGFLSVWLMEQFREGNSPIGVTASEACRSYAAASLGGWRSKSLSGDAKGSQSGSYSLQWQVEGGV